jgi:hypothetical protein
MDDRAGTQARATPAGRCITAWVVVDNAVRGEVLQALDGLADDQSIEAWSQRLQARAAVTDTALRDLRDSYLALADCAPHAAYPDSARRFSE